MKMDKIKRKQLVKEKRREFKENPTLFLRNNVIHPTLKYWKEKPSHATFTFLSQMLIMILIFGSIQAINNDMIYCDSTIDEYDGKLMYTHNSFVKFYNSKIEELEASRSPSSIEEQKKLLSELNEDYTMYCNYNLTKWTQEPIRDRVFTTAYGFKKILLKES